MGASLRYVVYSRSGDLVGVVGWQLAFLVLDAAPREIRVLGRRDGVTLEPATGIRLVEGPA